MSYQKTALMAAALLVALSANPLAAQSAQKWSIQVSFFSSTLTGDNPIYQNLDPGAGFEVQGRWTPSLFSLGFGFQWTSHQQTLLADDPNVLDQPNTTLNGFFMEPRYVILVGSNSVAPYLSARVSLLRQRTNAQFLAAGRPTTITATADGINFGGGGGLLFRLNSRINLDVGATYGFSSFGDFVTEVDNQEFSRVGSTTGQNLNVRLGVAIGL